MSLKKIDPKDIPEPIRVPRPREGGGTGTAEVEVPTELEDDLPCWVKISEGKIKSGRRRYACMVLAGHLRDEGVPKAATLSYMRDYHATLPQPPEADSPRPWKDVKRIVDDMYDEEKGYRVGCETVNRYFPDFCDPEDCPIEQGEEGEGEGVGEKEWQTVARNILDDGHFVTAEDSDDIYVYERGVYRPRGEIVVKKEAQSRLGREVTTHYVNEITNFVKRDTYIRGERFNNPVELVNVENGLLNPETGELKEHTPEHVSTSQLPVEYDREADCPKIKRFVKDTVPEQHVAAIQELFGYCLLKDCRFQKAFLWVGEGENGKSTLANLLARFLGQENIASESLQKLVGDRFSPAELRDKLANVYSDLPQDSLKQTGMFKMLTGGDPIRAERKFGHPLKFWNFAKLVFSANRLPETYDDTHAFYRRLILIDFPYRFKENPDPEDPMEKKKDPKILEKITTEEELSGLLNWALEGLKRLLKNGEFSYDKSTSEIREHYLKMSDPVGSFAEDCLEQDPEEWELKETVYSRYRGYCEDMDVPILDNNVFARKLKKKVNVEKYRPTVDGKQRRAWRGIFLSEVKNTPDTPDTPDIKKTNSQDSQDLNNFVEETGEVEDLGSLGKCELCTEEFGLPEDMAKDATDEIELEDGSTVRVCERCMEEHGKKREGERVVSIEAHAPTRSLPSLNRVDLVDIQGRDELPLFLDSPRWYVDQVGANPEVGLCRMGSPALAHSRYPPGLGVDPDHVALRNLLVLEGRGHALPEPEALLFVLSP